jgi:EmrB/QacA subfamily drug resistance transporter
VFGLALFTVASAACALAPTAGALVGCRAIQGLGAAIIMPLGLTLLTSAFPAERRGAVVGIWGGIAGLAVAAGPLIGGAVTQGLSWHWIFWVNVPVGILAVIGSRLRLPESWGPRTRLDIPALVLVSAGVGALIWGLVRGSQAGWGSAEVLVGLFAGALLMVAFLAWEIRAPEPMIPLGLFRVPSFSAAVTTQFLMSAAIFSAAFLISQFFQFALGDSPLGTGLRFLPWTATPLLIAPVAGALSDRVGARPLVLPGLLMQGLGFGWIVSLAGTHSGYASYVLPFVIAGTGISMALPCVSAAGLNAVPPESLGKAAGILNTLQQFGAVFGIAIVTAVFNSKGSLAGTVGVTNGFRPALAVSAGLSVLGAVAAVGIRKMSRAGAGESSASAESQLREVTPVFETD